MLNRRDPRRLWPKLPGAMMALAALLASGPGTAQQSASATPPTQTATDPAAGQNGPLSAIDWLSNSVALPRPPAAPPSEPAISPGAGVAPVSVAPLDNGPTPDATGILPAAVTGLPADLWGPSHAADIARRIRGLPAELLPALQAELYTILLAELEPPAADPASGGEVLFLARVDKLLQLGALDQAGALLEQAGSASPEIFRRRFDVALLMGEEQPVCKQMSASPKLSPTYQARIFCLARSGDWDGAALLLGTGQALGLIPEDDAVLFARFLDPELFEGADPLPRPPRITPLTFRMYEAIGEAIPTNTLPLAFARSDLRPTAGWKARIEAGERLARTGAVSGNQLLGLYTERRPAASGGVWDRAAALQKLEANMAADNHAGTASALPAAWQALRAAHVEVPIAQIHGPALAAMDLTGEAGEIALHLGLLSDDYEAVALDARPETARDALLVAIARGEVGGLTSNDPRAAAVLAGFAADAAPVRLATLVENGRLGEAILRAMTLMNEAAAGNTGQVTDALALLRAVGLEDTARRAALEFLILDRQQ